jgi:hypothetical protein
MLSFSSPKVQLPMGTELDGFESIGANCEFGQLLRKVGNETLTAFRWTGILSVEALISALDANLYGIFRFENLVPFNSDMILEQQSRIAWHSEIKSERIGPDESGAPGTLRFTQTEPERKWLYDKQRFVVRLLCDATRRSLKEGRVIFVYRPPPSDEACFSLNSMVRIFEALNRRGSHKLLVVTTSSSSERPGNIEILRPGLAHGFIDRFAPGDDTTDLSLDCWLTLCRKAKRALQETQMNARPDGILPVCWVHDTAALSMQSPTEVQSKGTAQVGIAA